MAHFALIEDASIELPVIGMVKRVLTVVVVDNHNCLDENGQESEEIGAAFLKAIYGADSEFIKTSYNGKIRKNFAGPGYYYSPTLDVFIPPIPSDDSELNTETFQWKSNKLIKNGENF